MPLDHLSDDDYDRLARYIAGEGKTVERAETERWAAADAERCAALLAIQLAWRTPSADPGWNLDAAWTKVSAELPRIALGDDLGAPILSIAIRRRWWHDTARVMQVAATAIVIIGGALLLPQLRPDGGSVVATVAASTYSTRSGERRTVRLPDGSTVILGVSSTLRTREGYGSGAREVELDGEALFTVEHDAGRPFRVFAGGTMIEDLGTAFAIRRYPADARGAATLRVAVSAGSVAIHRGTSADTTIVLKPREVATVRDANVVTVRRDVDVAPFTAFASGRLIFVDTPFADVAEELRRWYGVEVRVTDDALLDRHLTSEFQGESLDEVLRIIGLALDLRFTRSGNRVDFMAKVGVTVAPQLPSEQLAEAGA
ncbi:MAG: FecR domain-containing protein [Gemmatimonadota bacterium]